VISKEINRFYSRYNGQTWKNVITIGDSNFERYGTVGAAGAYVQKRFGESSTTKSMALDTDISAWHHPDNGCKLNGIRWSQGIEHVEDSAAYVKAWKSLDTDRHWGDSLEGVHEGHLFKVRTKAVKLLDQPSAFTLHKQMEVLLQCFPSLVSFDGCLNVSFDGCSSMEEVVNTVNTSLMVPQQAAMDKSLIIEDAILPMSLPVLEVASKGIAMPALKLPAEKWMSELNLQVVSI
jgi:hypothetical protein